MKSIIYYLLIVLCISSCYKDDTVPQEKELSLLEVATVRNGDYYPFLSHITLVQKDVFSNTTYVYNIHKIDSVYFSRISTSRHKYNGYIFNPYKVTIKYIDGSNIDIKALCQESLGNYKIIRPDTSYNQLYKLNKNHSITIVRTNRYYMEYNPYCGEIIYKWMYKIKDDTNSYTIPITGLCDTTLPYIQIFK